MAVMDLKTSCLHAAERKYPLSLGIFSGSSASRHGQSEPVLAGAASANCAAGAELAHCLSTISGIDRPSHVMIRCWTSSDAGLVQGLPITWLSLARLQPRHYLLVGFAHVLTCIISTSMYDIIQVRHTIEQRPGLHLNSSSSFTWWVKVGAHVCQEICAVSTSH
ncbi:TPA: hypothetical protein ACH3X2_010644 [Trebouxia sp. C0005]